MFGGRKNLATSSKTPSGSQHQNISDGHMDSVQQSALKNPQPLITVEAVNRVLDAGRILRAVLTPEELSALADVLRDVKHGQNTFLKRE